MAGVLCSRKEYLWVFLEQLVQISTALVLHTQLYPLEL